MQIEGKRRSIWPRVLGYFLAAMLLLTLVSRVADALLLPVVECARPLPGARALTKPTTAKIAPIKKKSEAIFASGVSCTCILRSLTSM